MAARRVIAGERWTHQCVSKATEANGGWPKTQNRLRVKKGFSPILFAVRSCACANLIQAHTCALAILAPSSQGCNR
jgi:hypothetical protein